MRYTLVIAFQGTVADDRLLHAMMCVLGPARVAGRDALDEEPADALDVVLYLNHPDQGPLLQQAVEKHRVWLSERRVRLIVSDARDILLWRRGLPSQIAYALHRWPVKWLSADPEQALNQILDMTFSERPAAASAGRLEPDRLRPYVEDFLSSRHVCAFATAYRGLVTCEPIEYHYAAGHLYVISEGGQTLAGLLHHKHAAITILERYEGFDRPAGMQLSGSATVPVPAGEEYARCLRACDVDPTHVAQQPVILHAIDVRLYRADYVWPGFAELGVDVRQEYRWDLRHEGGSEQRKGGNGAGPE